MRVRHTPDDERSPTHLQQFLELLCTLRQLVHPVAYVLTEAKKLTHQAVQRLTHGNGSSEQCYRTTPPILTNVLQIVSQLKQHPPLERELVFFLTQPAMSQASVCQYRRATFRAAHLQNLGFSTMAAT